MREKEEGRRKKEKRKGLKRKDRKVKPLGMENQ